MIIRKIEAYSFEAQKKVTMRKIPVFGLSAFDLLRCREAIRAQRG